MRVQVSADPALLAHHDGAERGDARNCSPARRQRVELTTHPRIPNAPGNTFADVATVATISTFHAGRLAHLTLNSYRANLRRTLKLLTRSLSGAFDQAAPAGHGAGEADETVVDVEPAFPAHRDAAELVQQREGLLDDIAQLAQALHVGRLRLGDDRLGTTLAAGLAERFTAVALVGQQDVEAAPGRPATGG